MLYVVCIFIVVFFIVYEYIRSKLFISPYQKYMITYYDTKTNNCSSDDEGYESDISSCSDDDYHSDSSFYEDVDTPKNIDDDMFNDVFEEIECYIFDDIEEEFELIETSKVIHTNELPTFSSPSNDLKYIQLDETTLRKYINSRCLRGYIAEYQKLSIEFIEEFINELPIHLICKYQKLSESFIRKYYDLLDMSIVSEYQELSYQFLVEFEPYIEFSFNTRDKTTEDGYPCDVHVYELDNPNFYTSNMECKQCKQEYLDSYVYEY